MTGSAVVTTSWDDGHPLDLRLAELLARHGVTGTFYVPVRNPERATMNAGELRLLAEGFEIGGHTVNHVRLNGVMPGDARREVRDGKVQVEDTIGRPVTMFCYPGGKFNPTAVKAAVEAGFAGARTSMAFHWDWTPDPYLIPTSVHVYPHSRGIHLRHALVEGNFTGLSNFVFRLGMSGSWVQLALRQLERAVANGGCWHLWGHSWEIDELNAWGDLETVLREAGKSGARVVQNGSLPDLMRERSAS